MATKKKNSPAMDKNLSILEKIKSMKNDKLYIGGSIPDVNYISSWLVSLDTLTGWWIPRGRVVEIFWPSWSWKTSLAMKIAEQYVKAWERVLFMDTEWTYPKHLEKIYGIAEWIDVYAPSAGEEAIDFMVDAVGMWYWLIILDSVETTVPMAIHNSEVEASNLGNMWKLMTKFMRLIVDKLRDTWCTLICINHEKAAIWSYTWEMYRPWWNAIPYASSLSIRIRKDWSAVTATKDDKIAYQHTIVKIVKTKLKKLHENEIRLYLDVKQRFDWEIDMALWAVKYGIIHQWWAGWYKYWEASLGQGLLTIVKYFREHPETEKAIREELEYKIKIIDKQDDLIFEDDIKWYNEMVKEYNKKFGKEFPLYDKE